MIKFIYKLIDLFCTNSSDNLTPTHIIFSNKADINKYLKTKYDLKGDDSNDNKI